MESPHNQLSDPLQHAVYSTVYYFSLFDFAPTLLEVERWLLRKEQLNNHTPTLAQIKNALDTHPRIDQTESFYYILDATNANKGVQLAQLRKQKYIYSDQKYRRAQQFLPLLAAMPFVEAIWLTNSVAWANAREQSDIDLFIVTTPGRIWTARFFTTLWMRLFRQRPHETAHSKALCLSFYITKDHLNLEPYKIAPFDIHFGFWATQFYALYERNEQGHTTHQQLAQANTWLNKQFQRTAYVHTIPRRRYQQTIFARRINQFLELLPLEQILKRFQQRIMPQVLRNPAPESGVVISDHILKLHTNDNRKDIQKQWQQGVTSSINQEYRV